MCRRFRCSQFGKVNGAHELFTPEKLCFLIKHRNQGKTDGRKLLGSWGGVVSMATVASMDHVAPTDHVASMAAMEWWCRVVQELRWPWSWASKETEQFLMTSLRTTAAPRVSDGSSSLRRVDKIAGTRVQGSPYKNW